MQTAIPVLGGTEALEVLGLLALVQPGDAYVATNSIRHLGSFTRHLDTRFSFPNFGQSVLGRQAGRQVHANLRDQIPLGKILTRSIILIFFFTAALAKC